MMWAISNDRTAAVKYLLSRHVPLDGFDRHHTPLLSLAVHRDNYKLLRLLLDAGADPTLRDSAGNDLLGDLESL